MDYRLTKDDIDKDPEYLVAAFPSSKGNDWYPLGEYELSFYFSEQLAYRLIGVAEAYQLHFPNQLTSNKIDRSSLHTDQLHSLMDQLEFMRTLLNDKLLEDVIIEILRLAGKVVASNDSLVLVFEGP